MNQENQKNAEVISKVLNQEFGNINVDQAKILDVCCGVYDKSGTNYDEKGEIYEPTVAQNLAEIGYSVTGLDLRENKTQGDKDLTQGDKFGVVDGKNIDLKYTHRSDINIIEENWSQKLVKDWNVIIFLRSLDTPEILLHYQKTFDIDDLNLLSLEIAKIYFPIFAELLKPNGLFFTTDICNYSLCDDEFETQLYQNQVNQLFQKNGFSFIYASDGLSWFRKIF